MIPYNITFCRRIGGRVQIMFTTISVETNEEYAKNRRTVAGVCFSKVDARQSVKAYIISIGVMAMVSPSASPMGSQRKRRRKDDSSEDDG